MHVLLAALHCLSSAPVLVQLVSHTLWYVRLHCCPPHPVCVHVCRFIFSPEGSFFRTFLLDEVVKSIDALSREQLVLLVTRLGLSGVQVPVLLPGRWRACMHILVCTSCN